jgi:SSS family solute:Na+ symporter
MWIFTSFNFFGRAIIPMLWGLGALVYLNGQAPDGASIQAMPTFLAQLPKGLVGFLMAGMLAALMSTHSSYLLAWSGVLTEDILVPVVGYVTGREVPQRWRIWITRFFILCLGAFLLAFGLFYETEGAVWNYLGMTGTIYVAGALTLVAMGLYWKRATTLGAYLGILGGALPGLIYLVLRITSLIIEPAITELGHEPEHLIAVWSGNLKEPVVGVISYPLALTGMIIGSLWSGRPKAPVPAPVPPPEPTLEAAAREEPT